MSLTERDKMIVKVKKLKREGFITRLGIEFENGLSLYTPSFVFCRQEIIQQTSKKFGETVVNLRRLK